MKKTIIIILISILTGSLLSYYILNKTITEQDTKNKTTGTAFQIGVYTTYNSAYSIAEQNNGIVVEDNNLYRVYTCILTNKEAISKISNYYNEIGLKYYMKDIIVSDDFKDEISIYEEMINKSNKDTFPSINNNILSTYLNYI